MKNGKNTNQQKNFEIKRADYTKRYEIISNYHLYDSRLTLAEKGFFTCLLTLPQHNFKITKRATAEFLHISERTFNDYIQKLKKYGYITIKKFKNNKAIYELNAKPIFAEFEPKYIEQYTLQQLNYFLNDERIEKRYKDLIKKAIIQAQKTEEEFDKMLEENEQEFKENVNIDDELPF